jgi:hypothetical protein
LVALLLEDSGLDPTVAARAVLKLWGPNMRRDARLAAAAEASNPILIELRLRTVTGPWRTGNPHEALPWVRLLSRLHVPTLRQYEKRGGFERRYRADQVITAADSLREVEGWLAFRNFTQKAAKLEAALNKEF